VSTAKLTAIATANEAHTLEWLALSLTPGLGPTRARRVVEYLGGIAAVFHASLTELEATGILASSAQSLATGRSMELSREEAERGIAANVTRIIPVPYSPPIASTAMIATTACPR